LRKRFQEKNCYGENLLEKRTVNEEYAHGTVDKICKKTVLGILEINTPVPIYARLDHFDFAEVFEARAWLATRASTLRFR